METFKSKKEEFEFLVKNKDTLIAQKKAELKKADAICIPSSVIQAQSKAIDFSNRTDIEVKVIINTTNLFDNHKDVHIPGIWDKSLSENKSIMHLQEHKMTFDSIISKGENLKAYVQEFGWGQLGYNFEGKTQALVFESKVKKERNKYMFEQYAKGYVDQHSVGMMYVKILLAVNDEDYGSEFEAWQKYFPLVANKSDAETSGYMWVVKEAKVIEGSAVPLGSNFVTPTINIKDQPDLSTDNQPSFDTVKSLIHDCFKEIKI